MKTQKMSKIKVVSFHFPEMNVTDIDVDATMGMLGKIGDIICVDLKVDYAGNKDVCKVGVVQNIDGDSVGVKFFTRNKAYSYAQKNWQGLVRVGMSMNRCMEISPFRFISVPELDGKEIKLVFDSDGVYVVEG